MYEPEAITVPTERWGYYGGEGTDPEEPLTFGSGSSCLDPQMDPWTLKSTRWYSFWGTGEPVVVRVDDDFDAGLGIYWVDGLMVDQLPVPEALLHCGGWKPIRYQFDTELGTLYRIQVGSRAEAPSSDFGSYLVSLFPITTHGDRDHPLPLSLEGHAHLDSWGAPLLDPEDRGSCSIGEQWFLGDRSGWGRIDVPVPGTLHVEVEPDRDWEIWMVSLYPSGSDTPVSCAVGGEPVLDTYLREGSYSVEVTRGFQPRLDFEGSLKRKGGMSGPNSK